MCFPCYIIFQKSSVLCASKSTHAFKECEDFFMACFVLIPLKWPVLPHLGCVEPFVALHKGLHTCTLLTIWDFNCRLLHHACMTHAIPWTNTLLEWSCFRLVWLTAAAHSEAAPVNGDVNSGSKSDERSHERQSILPSHPVVVFVVDWIAQCL